MSFVTSEGRISRILLSPRTPGAVVKSRSLGELSAIPAAVLTSYGLWEALGCLCGAGRARGLQSLSELYNVCLDAKAVSFGQRIKH